MSARRVVPAMLLVKLVSLMWPLGKLPGNRSFPKPHCLARSQYDCVAGTKVSVGLDVTNLHLVLAHVVQTFTSRSVQRSAVHRSEIDENRMDYCRQ